MPRPTHAAHLLMPLLLLVVALSTGCEDKKSDEASSPAGAERPSETSPGQATDDDKAAAPTARDDGALLAAMKAAGFEPTPDVPFDDDGALPDAVANGEATGMTGSSTHVLRRSADDAYVQLFVATFDDEAAATAALGAQPAPAPVQLGDQLVWVLSFGEQPELVDAVRGVLAGVE